MLGDLDKIHYINLFGAGGENRTPVTSLENWDNDHYTTPANLENYIR